MATDIKASRTGAALTIARIVEAWAVLGGVVLLAVVAVNVCSVIGGIVSVPFPGDFELSELGVAIAVFAFLPYCELAGANVTADIFTARAGQRLLSVFKAFAAGIALLFALLLLWRMSLGLLDQKDFGYTTAILQVPVWTAFVPILISLFLLSAATLVTLAESLRGAAGAPSHD
ncbi:MAG: TRAP transporter small permease subunit [Pseudomonadota bacterium]